VPGSSPTTPRSTTASNPESPHLPGAPAQGATARSGVISLTCTERHARSTGELARREGRCAAGALTRFRELRSRVTVIEVLLCSSGRESTVHGRRQTSATETRTETRSQGCCLRRAASRSARLSDRGSILAAWTEATTCRLRTASRRGGRAYC
jgi:hypothetical protein